MDLLKASSFQSLLDSDLESIASIHSLDIEELDEAEYALPASEAPTLAEALSADEDGGCLKKAPEESTACAALQVEMLQAVSQQLTHAQERSSAGAATSLGAGVCGRLSVGTAHGKVLTFQDQVLRWVCDANSDRGAVSCLSYSQDGTRILVGFARGLVCQYESLEGVILRRVVLGGELWGVLQVTWAGVTGLALDTGGSVWLMKFSRPLGVRSARTSCLFSGARGEVVAMAARDARVLALATLSRVIVVAGGRAAGLKFGGASDTLPVLAWSESDERVLISARANVMQWLTVTISGSSISLRPRQRVALSASPLWMGWLGEGLAILDVTERLLLWGNTVEHPLDLAHIEPVYASALFKGVWTDGRVSRAMSSAGASALGGVCVAEGALSLLGRRGVLRLRPRDLLSRARALFYSDRKIQAIELLVTSRGTEANRLANEFINHVADKPSSVADKRLAQKIVHLCVKFELREELWTQLWDQCNHENEFVDAIADAIARGETNTILPAPDQTQALVERLAEFAPELVERAVAALPLTALDPHQCSVLAREQRLWRAVAAVAAALGGTAGAMRELCEAIGGGADSGAGDALLLVAADGLAGRGAAGTPLPGHAQPSARHSALQALLAPQEDGLSALTVLVRHDARALVRLLEQSAREPPFCGPLGKQNRLRVARAVLTALYKDQDKLVVLEFLAAQLANNALPPDRELTTHLHALANECTGERADRAMLLLLKTERSKPEPNFYNRPRVRWHLLTRIGDHHAALEEYFKIPERSRKDKEELFEYLNSAVALPEARAAFNDFALLAKVAEERPRIAASLISLHFPYSASRVAVLASAETSLEFTESLVECGRLDDMGPIHLKNLCILKPKEVISFLTTNSGAVRPEDASDLVKRLGPAEAVPFCLEAVGDLDGALDAYLGLGPEFVGLACSLCSRVAPAVPAERSKEMWRRVAEKGAELPAALLPDSVAEALAAGGALRGAALGRALAGARRRRDSWRAARGVLAADLHTGLARARRAASLGRAAGALCAWCGTVLAGQVSRVCSCGSASHERCGVGCARCGRTESTVHCGAVSRTATAPPPHDLSLVAPPRPDLEGIV